MKYCSNCGAELTPGAKFCIKCGAPVAVAQANAPVTPTPQPSAPVPPTQPPVAGMAPVPQPQSASRKKLWLGLITGALVLIAGFGWWYTHQWFNLGKTAFRTNTLYAIKTKSRYKVENADAFVQHKDTDYLEFLPNKQFYYYSYGINGDSARGFAEAGHYTITNGVLKMTYSKKGYIADAAKSATIRANKVTKNNISKERITSVATLHYTLEHANMTTIKKFAKGKKIWHATAVTPIQPLVQKKTAIDPQTIYAHWAQLVQ